MCLLAARDKPHSLVVVEGRYGFDRDIALHAVLRAYKGWAAVD
jgi:hypothetical protein